MCRNTRRSRLCRRVERTSRRSTSWGDPAIAGAYNNSDESGIPFERPAGVRGPHARQLHTQRAREDHAAAPGADDRAQPDAQRVPRRDEPDALVRELLRREQPRVARLRSARRPGAAAHRRGEAARRRAPGRAEGPRAGGFVLRPEPLRPLHHARHSGLDDAGDLRQFVSDQRKARSVVTITYEMVHDTRVIPLDGRPHVNGVDPPIPRRRARALGRQHARRRDDQLHRQDALPRLEPVSEARRALHAARAGHARMVRDVRRSAHVDAAVDVHDEPHARRGAAAVRVRVPRRQLRSAQRALGSARGRGCAAEGRSERRPSALIGLDASPRREPDRIVVNQHRKLDGAVGFCGRVGRHDARGGQPRLRAPAREASFIQANLEARIVRPTRESAAPARPSAARHGRRCARTARRSRCRTDCRRRPTTRRGGKRRARQRAL